ncbi:MAG: TRAP transporter substrate-binding protein [Kiritimatiellae bacterium]|nr:TRAP transporter substrate-binding protein [Kiritimatiellia bacterium]
MRKTFLAVSLTAGVLLTSGSGVWAQRPAPQPLQVLKYGHPGDERHPFHQTALAFRQEVAARFPGVTVEILTGREIGGESALVKALRKGEIDVGPLSSETLMDMVRDYELLAMPFLLKDAGHFYRVMESDWESNWSTALEDQRLIRLGYIVDGARDFWARGPVTSLAELAGKTIGLPGNWPAADAWEKLGAVPKRVSWRELSEGLAQGTIDCGEGTVQDYLETKAFASAPYYVRVQAAYTWHAVCLARRTWWRFSPGDKVKLMQAGLAAVEKGRTYFLAHEKALGAQISAQRVEVKVPQDIQLWRKKVEPVHKEVADDLNAADLLKAIEGL